LPRPPLCNVFFTNTIWRNVKSKGVICFEILNTTPSADNFTAFTATFVLRRAAGALGQLEILQQFQ